MPGNAIPAPLGLGPPAKPFPFSRLQTHKATQTMTRAVKRPSLVNTKLLMSSSAVFMGLLGLGISFFPQELLSAFDSPATPFPVLLSNVAGALYFGFAIVNWMAREKLIGGIYSRPVAVGNFAHFFAATLVMIKHLPGLLHLEALSVIAAVYALFAVAFGYVTMAGAQACQ